MLTVYKVGAEYLEARRKLLEMHDDEDMPINIVTDTLAGLSHDVKETSLNFAAICKNLAPEIESMRNYELKMQKKRRALEKELEAYKKWLIENMTAYELQRIENDELLIYKRKNAESVKISDDVKLDKLPTDCVRIKLEADKDILKEKIRAGQEFKGITLERTESVIIK